MKKLILATILSFIFTLGCNTAFAYDDRNTMTDNGTSITFHCQANPCRVASFIQGGTVGTMTEYNGDVVIEKSSLPSGTYDFGWSAYISDYVEMTWADYLAWQQSNLNNYGNVALNVVINNTPPPTEWEEINISSFVNNQYPNINLIGNGDYANPEEFETLGTIGFGICPFSFSEVNYETMGGCDSQLGDGYPVSFNANTGMLIRLQYPDMPVNFSSGGLIDFPLDTNENYTLVFINYPTDKIYYYEINYITDGTCFDGILNQDETSTDFGGVCALPVTDNLIKINTPSNGGTTPETIIDFSGDYYYDSNLWTSFGTFNGVILQLTNTETLESHEIYLEYLTTDELTT